jgi:hypothetical protein
MFYNYFVIGYESDCTISVHISGMRYNLVRG